MHRLFLFILFFKFIQPVVGQVFEDRVYDPSIKTVLLYNTAVEQSLPILKLNSSEKLLLSFDDLSIDLKDFSYTIEHCTSDWKSSRLVQSEYIDGFYDNPLNTYRFSFNTRQPYTHYELNLPNDNMSILLSGNYIVKVYRSGNSESLALTRRFIVIDTKVSINALIDRSSVVNDRTKKQKINVSIDHPEIRIDNPFNDIKVVVMQNGRWDNAKFNTSPTFIRLNQLVYDHVDANVFDGLNEFRKFDTRSMRFLSERMERIETDTANVVYLQDDPVRQYDRFVTDIDMNGNFFIRNREGRQPELDADYVYVNFALDYGTQNPYGNFYVLGKMNDWQANEKSKMKYNFSTRRYEAALFLKQGIYNYTYAFVAKDAQLIDMTLTEGNHFDTENDYIILVYHRRTGSFYDELIGMHELNTRN